MNHRTGQAWYVDNQKWVEMRDPVTLKEGYYEFKPVFYQSINEWDLWRIDPKTGQAWTYFNNLWQKIN